MELLDDIASEFEQEFVADPEIPEPCNQTTTNKPESSASTTGFKTSTFTLLVNPKQRGNPILKSVCNVPWEYSDIVPDYQMGATMCALYLSLRYHNLNPDYIHDRLKQLGNMYQLRILLVQVDVKDPHHLLKNLTRVCILADLTLILAWSCEEAGKILETYKMYENKPPDNVMGKSESSPYLKLCQALTSVRAVNKTDAMNLLNKYKTIEALLKASVTNLAEMPGIGPRKAKTLHAALHENFCK